MKNTVELSEEAEQILKQLQDEFTKKTKGKISKAKLIEELILQAKKKEAK